ncbi:FAST kinase domain-containing protein 5, mitochondrial-like [Asterias rubens]|uniref:FAST kinase domain-containing protein 5, mitochondrial-like n=1 Tax=Asterias rubens TaxID=7604 RepID=UPI0014558F3C|nr:FAST kinase domain-containing protein 5, mitochondrial-like [Asterias rubens]
MSWRHSHCVAVRMLFDLSPSVKIRSSQKRLFQCWRHCDAGQDSAQSSSSLKYRSTNNEKQVFADKTNSSKVATGLFHLRVDVSKFLINETNEPLTNGGALQGNGKETIKKHPYIQHGKHLDPVVFNQLSQDCTSLRHKDSEERETFHPKFTPRIFYRESVEYADSAVVFPQVRNKSYGISEEDCQFERESENLLNDILFSDEIEDGVMLQLLDSLNRCRDEFMLGLAEDERFLRLVEHLGHHCADLESKTLVKALVVFARAQIRTSNPVLRILETKCEEQWVRWDVKTSLLVCDAWRLIGLPVRHLNSKIFNQMEKQLHQLTKQQIVQVTYLIGENRHAKTSLLNGLQDLVLENIASLSYLELGAICQGFFKSKTNLKPGLVGALVRRIQSKPLDDINSYYLVGILKVFRQAYFGHSNLFDQIGDQVSGRLQTFPVSSIMHILLTYATLHLHHADLLEAGARELILRSNECRCKDLSKVLWSFGTLNYLPQDSERFFRTLTSRMVDLLDEYNHFPIFLVSGLLSLAYLNIYPAELLDVVFSPSFLLRMEEFTKRSSIDPRRDLFALHASTQIDCPEYGHHLNKEFMLNRPLPPGMFGSLHAELTSHPLLRAVYSTLASLLGGEQNLRMSFIMPHMKTADIEVHLDSSDRPVPFGTSELQPATDSLSSSKLLMDKMDPTREQNVPLDFSLIANLSGETSLDKCRNTPTGIRTASVKPAGKETAPIDNVSSAENTSVSGSNFKESLTSKTKATRSADWSRFEVPEPITDESATRLAVLVWSRNHFHFNGTTLLGLHSMKRRHLMKLGYQIVDIPFFEWDRLTGNRQRERYIQQKIFMKNMSNVFKQK